MKHLAVALLIVIPVSVCGGCYRPGQLRTVDMGGDGGLGSSVCNETFHHAGNRPRVQSVQVWVDEQAVSVPVHLSFFNSKYGWCESVSIPAPAGAKTARIEAVIRSDGKTYRLRQEFRLAQAEREDRLVWQRQPAVIVPIPEASGKT